VRVNRYERADATLKPPQRRDNGFTLVEGRISRIGVQVYQRADGSVSRELRLPEEVFHPDSLASFALLPVTNRHPPGMLTAKNAKKYAVGSVGENVRQDDDYVAAPLLIHDSDAIEAVEKGRTQLSCGYSCELDPTQDESLIARWGKYDAIMRNIRGNHVAIVDVARAGPGASIRLDANDGCSLDLISLSESSSHEAPMENAKMHKFTIDGFAIEVADANAQAIIERCVSVQKERADTAEQALAEAKKDAEAKTKALEAQVAEQAEKLGKFDAAVDERVKLLGSLGAELGKHGVDVAKLDSTEEAYLKAGLAKRSPKLDTAGADLRDLRIMWKAIQASPEPSAVDKARAGVGSPEPRNDGPSSSAEEARRRYNERLFSVAK
jgi:uncharacterized protein